MELRSLVPFNWGATTLSRRGGGDDPFLRLRREVDQLFDDFFGGSGIARWPGDQRLSLPLDVSETDKEITVTAELPGVDEKDIEVALADDLLTIRGEKKVEKEHKSDNVFMAERSYGSFSRSLRLPFGVDEDKVEAKFKNGVLTITLPKPPEVQQSIKKIEVKAAA